jgi:predicted enzyme related to lactoylglutathione lyase
MISNVSKVVVPVDDQDTALAFWATTMGFTVVRDETFGDERWIEVKPPEQDLLLVLSPRRPGDPPREVPYVLPHSDLFFNCADIEKTYAELSQRGVRFPLRPSQQDFGWWALFEDDEGIRYALGQWDEQPARGGVEQEGSQVTHSAPVPDPALRRLDFLVGRWRIEGQTMPGFPGPAMSSSSTETFEWLPGGFFLVHRWDGVFGDPADDSRPELPGGAVQKGIMFYGYDAATRTYCTHFFDGNGPFHEGSMYQGKFVGDGLEFAGPARFILVQNEDGTVTNDWQLPGDAETWVPWRHTVMTRLDEPDANHRLF